VRLSTKVKKEARVSLREIVRAVRSHWIVALLTLLVFLVAGLAYVTLPAKQYQATVVLVAVPPRTATDPGALVGAIQIEIPQVVVEVSTPVVQNVAKDRVPARYQSVPVSISAAGDPASNTITISAKSTDPRAAQAWANAVAARVVKVTNQTDYTVLVLSQLGTAALPTSPTGSRASIVLAAFALGLIAAVFAALGSAAVGRHVAAEEIWERVGIAVVGEVPRLAHTGTDPTYIFESAGDPFGQEAFQQLRAFLQLMYGEMHPVIAITSCDPRDGKSTVAAHTAWALANPGHLVAAVDADLRKPSLHEIFARPVSPGVSDFDAVSLNDLLATTANPYLEFIASGLPTRHPADVVTADVLDCPPVMGVAETSILATKADGVLVVVNARNVKFDRIVQCITQLRGSGANVIGIVLNRVRRPKALSSYSYIRPSDAPTSAESSNQKPRRVARLG
jgi:Mrp family chromosome partitioning ATPase/capsular polysaccharide biosynthesis protein